MNTQEITEIIKALAPAGEAVSHTASLFIVSEMMVPVAWTATILGTVKMVSNLIKWHTERVDVLNIKEEIRRLTGSKDGLTSGSYLDYQKNEELKRALGMYLDRHTEIRKGLGGVSIRYASDQPVDELIKYLKEHS